MGRSPAEPNVVCAECGELFRRGPKGKCIRCPQCRTGKQGRGVGPAKTSVECPLCGGRKSRASKVCARCYWGVVRGLGVDAEHGA
ncbi:MAG TPA: hypothetical protein VM223_11765 [Planctomycetota bacterium]|nr:hypothetical protein [Planctomycetota bacterium]